jgi:hypothetical protein
MSASPVTVSDDTTDEEAATLVLVDENDIAVGSVSLKERLAIADTETESPIHRTCSLYVFWNEDGAGNGRLSQLLLSRLSPCTDTSPVSCQFCSFPILLQIVRYVRCCQTLPHF